MHMARELHHSHKCSFAQVYNTLSKVLPNFGPENWTSRSRGKFPGQKPYTGPCVTNFNYSDSCGTLTGLLYDEETKEAWKDKWPTYRLDVISTSGKPDEMFHMTRAQIEQVSGISVF